MKQFSKYLMTTSAIIMGAFGIILSFLPQETAGYLGITSSNIILMQILGALYFGFAMANWTAKGNVLGGIFGRGYVIGNFSHFLIGALALIKFVLSSNPPQLFIIITLIYTTFAASFAYLMFYSPSNNTQA